MVFLEKSRSDIGLAQIKSGICDILECLFVSFILEVKALLSGTASPAVLVYLMKAVCGAGEASAVPGSCQDLIKCSLDQSQAFRAGEPRCFLSQPREALQKGRGKKEKAASPINCCVLLC